MLVPSSAPSSTGALAPCAIEAVYWFWRHRRDAEASIQLNQGIDGSSSSGADSPRKSVARGGFLLRAHQTIACGDLPLDAGVNVLARIIGLDRVAVAKAPSHAKGASSVASVAAAKILAEAAASKKAALATGASDEFAEAGAAEAEVAGAGDPANDDGTAAPPPLCLFSPRMGFISERARTKDVESNVRALTRLKTLRQHLERLRLLLDLTRKRERFRRQRVACVSAAVESLLPQEVACVPSSAAPASGRAPTAAELFDYQISAVVKAQPSAGPAPTSAAALAVRQQGYSRRRDQARTQAWPGGAPPLFSAMMASAAPATVSAPKGLSKAVDSTPAVAEASACRVA